MYKVKGDIMSLITIDTTTMQEVIKANITFGIKRPTIFLGKGGIGKTAIIDSLAKELGIGYVDIRLLLFSEVDLKGIPYPDADHCYTKWLQNDILPRADRDGEVGILVFDEVTSATKTVRTAVYQLLNERRLGSYVLPEGWFVVCLGNGEEDGGDFKGLEGNFANRCSVYKVQSSIESYKDFAIKAGIHPLVISFIESTGYLHTYNPDSDAEEALCFASPRSWSAVSDMLYYYSDNLNAPILHTMIKGNIGLDLGSKFTSFLKYSDTLVHISDVLDGNMQDIPDSIDGCYVAIQGIINILNNDTCDDNELLRRLCNGVNWIAGIKQPDLIARAIIDLSRRSNTRVKSLLMSEAFLTNCPAYSQFLQEHSAAFQ